MKKVTGIAILQTEVGEKITYTFSEIDDSGTIIQNNVKRSYVVMDTDTESIIAQLKTKVSERLNME